MIPILDAIMPVVGKLLDFIPDPQKKAEAKQKMLEEMNNHSEEILKALTAVDTSQNAVNAEEAKSSNFFVAGWRPCIGWVCGLAFVWGFVLRPFLEFILAATGHPVNNLPQLNMSEMMPVLLGMLGLAGMRTWEKSQEVQDKH